MPVPRSAARELLETLEDLARAQREAAMRVARDLDLPRAGLGALHLLTRCGRVQLSDVAAKLRVDMSVASRQVSALVDAGFVQRTVDDDDRRARYLALTDTGREFAEASFERIDDLVSEAFSDWSEQDLADATSRIRSVAAALTTTHDRAQAQEEIPAR
ncbi:MarR family winged helix-turn-helix transcriptional regulator [Krasilnikoviella flava]|uniref:DNA-binding transcriptional regulator, MarR family n=1 Tax=Krasilnikoviella flava TaxID=526729 RepID=A0A1T5LH03_9MICO|nr:MarR family transcriptional regulator [Krasilnikoviella flava]SKC75317.1 DNA-binding transcriptional regulator, MarR family [Krasilnikoviella flava]